jgi:UDP-N-acetylmuramyl pentapeptide phosphotransferase/UDP-N-acetylglucosamine-1-phosphate transferase
MSPLLTVGAVAAILAWALVAGVRYLSIRWHLYDHPNERSSHVRPTPRLGGVALAVVLVSGLWIAAANEAGGVTGPAWWLLSGVGAAVALVSLADDLRPLPVLVRLATHLAAAAAVLLVSGPLEAVPLGTSTVAVPAWLGAAIVLLWVAGFINAFNFMDGIDGIAGGQAVVAGLGWIVLGSVLHAPALAIAGALVAGSGMGFLRHNWSPASIFMGDAGSALLGFLLSAGPLLLGGQAAWLPGVLLVWPFLFDTTVTLVRRLCDGEPVWQAHRSHLYQRLAPERQAHPRVALLYVGLAAVGGLLALWTVQRPDQSWAVSLVLAVLAALLWFLGGRQQRPKDVVALPSSLEL